MRLGRRWRRFVATEGAAAVTALACATLVGAVLRFATLGDQSFWADEGVSVTLAKKSLGDLLSTIPHTESTPPLYYLLEWVAVRIFGSGEAGARALSALTGTALIPVGYAVARTLVPRRLPAVGVAVLAAVSPVLVWYSQEARAYALYALLDAVALLFLARAWRDPSSRNLWGCAVACALGVATHYFGGFFAIACSAALLVRCRREALLPAAVALAPGVALLPLAKYQFDHQDATRWISAASLDARVKEVAERFTFLFWNPTHDVGLALVVAAAALLAWRARRDTGARLAAAVVAVTAGLPLLLAAIGIADVFYYRNVLAIWLPLVVVLAAGLPSTRVGAAVIAVAALPLLASTIRTASEIQLQRDSWRDAVAAAQALPGRRLVVSDYLDEPYVLPLYWPSLEPVGARGVEVQEIVMIGHYLTAQSRLPSLPAFRPTEAIRAGNLVIVRLRADAPHRVAPPQLPSGGGLLDRG
jgi:4-amino-4-deoxy-L-arabinose transferase-like glycosyltransferase